jgi:hypothetical protein
LTAESWGLLLQEKRLHADSVVDVDESRVLRQLYK